MRNFLLVTTALVFVGWAAIPAVEARAASRAALPAARTTEHHRNVNDEFLCTYGFSIDAHYSTSSTSTSSSWHHVAVPIIGRGKAVSKIFVRESRVREPRNYGRVSVGIYSNTASGTPGTLIAKGVGRARNRCLWISAAIAPTTLDRGTKYWIEETSVDDNATLWATDPNAKYNAYEQSHWFFSTHIHSRHSSYTSKWMPLAGGAYVKVR